MRYLRLLTPGLLALSMLALTRPACAQPRGPARPPSVTPFLAIGPGSNPSNYFTIVKPTLDFRAVEKRQQTEIGKLEQRLGNIKGEAVPGSEFESTLPKTGHRVYFGNTSHYYPRPTLR
jgi:hypothetical protein